jgi:hypothetical protein
MVLRKNLYTEMQITFAMNKLTIIKFIHTVIWVFFNLVPFIPLLCRVCNKIDKWVWYSIGIILLEGIVLGIFKQCAP